MLALVGLSLSCTDQSTAPVIEAEAVWTAVNAGNCDLVPSLASDVKNYFAEPELSSAKTTVGLIANACSAGDAALVSQYAISLLGMTEVVVANGRGGDPVVGSRLVNGLLACTTAAGCTSAALPGIDLSGALGSAAGTFAVRAGSAADAVVARGTVPFTDFTGADNTALFGAELTAGWSWTQANGGGALMLLYGTPVTTGLVSLLDTGVGGLQYDMNRWPDNGTFVEDDIVHVGVCFGIELEFPHDHATGESTRPRMQRESTLLSARAPSYCPPSAAPQTASFAAPLLSLARGLLPRGWFAMGDVRSPAIGGSAYDFSRFAPVAADVQGTVAVLDGPQPIVQAGQPIGTIRVQSRSGGGTPMERVFVRLYLTNNKGEPAGAILMGETSGYTSEADGTVVFDNVSIPKTGGYILCAEATIDGFTFTQLCWDRFHVRK